MYNLGLPLAMFLQVVVIIVTHSSSNLYLWIKDIVPDSPTSLYEIGYMIVGRASIFLLGSVFFLNSVGLCMIYFMVFGDTGGQLAASFTENEKLESVWYTSRWFYDVILAGLLLPICIQKELAELAWISYILFASLALFTLTNFILLTFDSRFEALGMTTEVLTPKVKWETISAMSVTMLAYSYQ